MTRSSGRNGRVFQFCVCLFAVLFFVGTALAQTSSAIGGQVKDPQGNLVPGAKITLTNLATGATRTQTSNSTGNYSFELLPPGDYKVEAEAKGFRKSVVNNVHALVAKAVDLDLHLQVGAANEEITVTAESGQVLVNTQDASVGNNFTTNQITQLPLEAHNIASLLTLQPGVTRQGYVAGARSDQSNVSLDGVDINEPQTNALAGTGSANTAQAEQGPVLRLNQDSVEEFRVTTTTTNAAGARSSGAQIALVTKSGTNAFHGSAYESHRNTIFSANDWFNNHNKIKRPTLLRNTYGGSLGGPIIKNKLFFFYSYEGRRDASASLSGARTIPLASLGQGILRYPSGGGVVSITPAQMATIFPGVGGENPAAVSFIAGIAAKYTPNDFSVGDSTPTQLLNTAGFRFNAPTPVKLNSHVGRLDYNINSKQSLFVRANVIYDHLVNVPQFPDLPAPGEWDHPWGIAAGHTWTIHNNIVNNFRYGLTRQAFSQLGDSSQNEASFRFIYNPIFTRTLARTNPVHNFVDDLSWVKGNHTIQFGTNLAFINNGRASFTNAYDNAITNPSFYSTGLIRNPIDAFSPIASGFGSAVENAATALIGRFTQYTANFTFGHDGSLLPSGTPSARDFKNWGVEGYAQDVWKMTPNLTITAGLRYSLWRPVYEANGFEAKPDIPLGTYFQNRLAGAAAGTPYAVPVTVNLSGSANHASPLYHWDKTNFQPRIAVAWSPRPESGLLARIFGSQNQSVIRGGFTMTGDYFGQAVAAFFDTRNTLGFGSSTTISANTYNVDTKPGPLFTGFTQAVRPLPGIAVPGKLTFPQQKPQDYAARIESSLDENLVTPKSYAWSLTYERQLPAGLVIQASYLGRAGRHLLAQRDIMALNNLVDPKSKMDWYTAATILAKQRAQGVPAAQIQPIPYFENLFPDVTAMRDGIIAGESLSATKAATLLPTTFTATQLIYQDAAKIDGGDWTTAQLDVEGTQAAFPFMFYQGQYGALTAFSSIGNSNYNAFTFSVRQRYRTMLSLDFNYTYSHSLDDASGLQSSGAYGSAFILNPIQQGASYANSDFDTRHQININSVLQIPVGTGKTFLSNVPRVVNGIIGGWSLSNIFRWNTGLPTGSVNDNGVFDDARWATNWEVQSNAFQTAPFGVCPTRPTVGTPKLFGCNTTFAFQHFRNPYPGETGQRNIFRIPGFIDLDMGLGKTFNLSGISSRLEGHTLAFRWEVFNVTNTQRMGNFDGSRSGFGIPLDPNLTTPPTNFSNFTSIQPLTPGVAGGYRVMQFSLRYAF